MRFLCLIFLIFSFIGCCPPGVDTPQIPLRVDIAARMDDFTEDWLLTPLHDVFMLEELAWLLVHRQQLSDAINARITGHSTLAIQLAVYLRLESAIPLLREKLLTLRSPYGWEGPDYSTEDPWMWDNQYQYHSIYIWAIQGIAQAPIHEVVKLTSAERKHLREKAARAVPYKTFPDVGDDVDEVDGKAWCAKWLLGKLEPLADAQ